MSRYCSANQSEHPPHGGMSSMFTWLALAFSHALLFMCVGTYKDKFKWKVEIFILTMTTQYALWMVFMLGVWRDFMHRRFICMTLCVFILYVVKWNAGQEHVGDLEQALECISPGSLFLFLSWTSKVAELFFFLSHQKEVYISVYLLLQCMKINRQSYSWNKQI